MTNSEFQIYYKNTTFDEAGNPELSHIGIVVRGHVEISSVKTVMQDEGVLNKTFLQARITDAESHKKIKSMNIEPDYLVWGGKKYTIAEIRYYYTYIEIITQ